MDVHTVISPLGWAWTRGCGGTLAFAPLCARKREAQRCRGWHGWHGWHGWLVVVLVGVVEVPGGGGGVPQQTESDEEDEERGAKVGEGAVV